MKTRQPIPHGMRTLIAWAIWEVNREQPDHGFPKGLLRELCYAALVHESFPAHVGAVVRAWAINPDMTISVMKIVRDNTPLPCSKTKKMRVWAYLLSPTGTIVTQTRSVIETPILIEEDGEKTTVVVTESRAVTDDSRPGWVGYLVDKDDAATKELADDCAEKLSAQELADSRNQLRTALNERGLASIVLKK